MVDKWWCVMCGGWCVVCGGWWSVVGGNAARRTRVVGGLGLDSRAAMAQAMAVVGWAGRVLCGHEINVVHSK